MSTQLNDTDGDVAIEPSTRLDALGDECARTILVATSDGPKTAKELTRRTESSSATVYRRINNLLESGLIMETIRFEKDGSHATAYEARVEELQIAIGTDGIDISITESFENR